jgi:methylated-DNA-[protein]-cysteine S-methyltransferase
LGKLTLAGEGESLTGLWLPGQKYFRATAYPLVPGEPPAFFTARRWLDAYFAGGDPGPTPPLAPEGTPFQKAVWEQLGRIPWGQTVTYGALAQALEAATGKKTSPRAVGGAVGRNPISILIPCHRVVGANSTLTGYAGGLERKRWLLTHEGVDLAANT